MSDADTIKILQRVVAEQERELLVLRPQVAALTAERDEARKGLASTVACLAADHDEAVAAEREACAKVAEAGAVVAERECAWESAIVLRGVAAAIRARGGQ